MDDNTSMETMFAIDAREAARIKLIANIHRTVNRVELIAMMDDYSKLSQRARELTKLVKES